MNPSTIRLPDVEIARAPPSVYQAKLSVEHDLVIQTEPSYETQSLVGLPSVPLELVRLVDLSVVAAELQDSEGLICPVDIEVPGDAEGIVDMILFKSDPVPVPVRDISIGLLDRDVWMYLSESVEQEPAHRGHLRCRLEPIVLRKGDVERLLAVVVIRVAFLAQRDEVGRPVGTAILALDDVVDFKMLTRATGLACEPVACLHIRLDIGIAQLFSFLILLAFDILILDLLNIKRGRLDDNLRDRQDRADIVDDVDMCSNLGFHRRREPAFGPSPVIKAGLAMAETVSASTPRLPTCSHKLRDIVT